MLIDKLARAGARAIVFDVLFRPARLFQGLRAIQRRSGRAVGRCNGALTRY
jgi:CHASE2 domain-containing sensor protein